MEISNTYFGESLKLVKKGEGKMIKKKHSQDKRDKNISALQVCTEILPIRSKKKKQFKIPLANVTDRWITLTSVWPWASNQDPKKLFFNPEKKMVDI